ncbi:MAG: HPr family phosphocarrier protein [Collinsella sp.]|nr:HPr family phosphocarrier protein [Collinsella sp.]
MRAFPRFLCAEVAPVTYNNYHVAGFAGRMCDAAGGDMVEFTKTIKDPLGLHARPVALLYDIIAKHRSALLFRTGNFFEN